uniref:GH10 domain-containing protein n=1 Tax=Oryza meridionalis TaxID=40149 RepID=A0A0E0C3K1_9ORYZ
MLREAYTHPAVDSVVLWGFWELFMCRDDAHVVDTEGEVNEAGRCLLQLKWEWLTRAHGHADDRGEFEFRSHHSAYHVDVVTRTGKISQEFTTAVGAAVVASERGVEQQQQGAGRPLYSFPAIVVSISSLPFDLLTLKCKRNCCCKCTRPPPSRLAVLGLSLWFTELDVSSPNEHVRADDLEVMLREAYTHPAVDSVVLWGFWELFMCRDDAHVVDTEGEVNEAGRCLLQLKWEWLTRAHGHADDRGEFEFRSHHSAYHVDVVTRTGKISQEFTVS